MQCWPTGSLSRTLGLFLLSRNALIPRVTTPIFGERRLWKMKYVRRPNKDGMFLDVKPHIGLKTSCFLRLFELLICWALAILDFV